MRTLEAPINTGDLRIERGADTTDDVLVAHAVGKHSVAASGRAATVRPCCAGWT